MNVLSKIFSSGATELVKGVGGVLDNLTTSKEEKLEAERKVKELVANYEVEMEKSITSRWEADLKSDSWLSKNVRPLVLIFLTSISISCKITPSSKRRSPFKNKTLLGAASLCNLKV